MILPFPSDSTTSHPALLCEKCGYDLTSLPASAVCPECATPLTASLPESRPGSAWQLAWKDRPWLLPLVWVRTSLRGLCFPGRQLRRTRIEAAGAHGLLAVNMLIASSLLTMRTSEPARELLLSIWPQRISSPAAFLGPTWPLIATCMVLLGWLGLFVFLTEVERLGVAFYSRRRGWRVDRTLSSVATAHASGAWPLAAFLGVALPSVLDHSQAMLPTYAAPYLTGLRFFAGSTGFIAGMIWFEMCTYFGIRACRYANPPGVRRPPA